MFVLEEKVLSDHMPVGVKSGNRNFVSYNMLMRMKYNLQKGFINNGQGANEESQECYHERLREVAQKCSIYASQNSPIAFCLQEAPTDEFLEKFKESFLPEFQKNYEFFMKKNPEIITLYDKKNYTKSDCTETLLSLALKEGLEQRSLPLVLVDNKTQEKILIINVHANFSKPVFNDVKILSDAARKEGIQHIYFIGDFNRDLKKPDGRAQSDICNAAKDNKLYLDSENYLYTHNIDSSSFMCAFKNPIPPGSFPKPEDLEHKTETRDGILSTEECELFIPMELYRLKNANIAPELSRMPAGFLEKREFKTQLDQADTSPYSLTN